MTVSASPATSSTLPATAELVDLRVTPSVRAGCYPYDGPDAVTRWHRHDLHEVEFAFEGVAEIESAAGHYLLSPQQAAWVPAGLAHRTTLRQVRSVSVFLDPALVDGGDRIRILAVPPVVRELYKYGRRWPIDRPASDDRADAYFAVVASLTADALHFEVPLCLPTSSDPLVGAAMDHTRAHLFDATITSVGAAVGASERTLRRRFAAETGMPWREYLLRARLLRAMALLADPGRSLLDVASEVGFEAYSSFGRAFRRFTGESPSAYRHRALAEVNAVHDGPSTRR